VMAVGIVGLGLGFVMRSRKSLIDDSRS
jgi:hypothetical protein